MDPILFILQLTFFLISSFILFTVPGIFLLDKVFTKFSFWEKFILGTVLGFTFFTLLSYFLLVVNAPWLLLPLTLLINLFALKNFKSMFKEPTLLPKKSLFFLLLVFSLGIFGQLLIISPSGIYQNGDLVFWSAHGHDGTWHIALMEEIKKGFPLQNPVFSGEKLVNYHFFSDISPAIFNLFFKISTLDLYFRFFPLLFSLLLGALSYLVGRRIGGNFGSGIWAAFFTYFAGSFGYIVTLIRDNTIGGESFFWASQIQSSSGNPPLLVSLVILLSLLLLLKVFFESKFDLSLFIVCSILLGSFVEFKSYGALVVLISLGIVGVWQIIKEHKIHILSLFILSSLISFVLFFPNSKGSTGFLIYEPWWFIRTMVVAPDRLNLLDWELRRQTYIAESNWKRVIQIELTGFLIFLIGNLGMRFLGFWEFIRLAKTSLRSYFSLYLVLVSLTSLTLPLLFLQKGVAGNTIQFFSYFLLIVGIFAGVSLSFFLTKIRFNIVKFLVIAAVIVLSIPTQLGLIYSFYSRPAFAKIDKEEIEALKYLNINANEEAIILTPPFDRDLNLQSSPPQIWDWSDTAYVSAISGKRTFLEDKEQLDIMGYNFQDRFKFQKYIFATEDPEIVREELIEKNIDYLYFPKLLRPKADLTKTGLQRVFSNTSVEVWKIK